MRPSIIPFFVDALNRIEYRVKASRPSVAPTGHSGPTALSSISESPLQIIANPRTGKCRLQLTLRIDRSELRLSCAPDSSAYVDLKWESGGFFASTTADEEQVTTMAGTVSGVTASLSHEFADQGRSCVEASAKDMAFSFTLCPGTINGNQKGLSIVLDTQLSAHFRLEAFSAWLIFIAVWVDSAPKLHIPLRASVPDAATTPSAPMSAAPPKLSVVALVRLRSVDFDANIAVSTARLEITPITLRTVSNGERTEVDLRSGVTQISARGDISGDVRSESLVFNTSRRSSRASSSTEATVLELSIDGGDLSGNLFLAETNIMRFQ